MYQAFTRLDFRVWCKVSFKTKVNADIYHRLSAKATIFDKLYLILISRFSLHRGTTKISLTVFIHVHFTVCVIIIFNRDLY